MGYSVQCASCNARFALTDDLFKRKVSGRTVVLRCKGCGADIKVDGNELGVSSSPPPKPQAKRDEQLWMVSFSDDDDRELTALEIGEALSRGVIDSNTIAWREGMGDWLPIGEIEELKSLVPATATGGFLGTGLELGGARPVAPAKPKSPAAKATAQATHSAADDEPPVSEEAPLSIEPEPISLEPESLKQGPVALSPGTMGNKPPPRRPQPQAPAAPPQAPKPPRAPKPPQAPRPPSPKAQVDAVAPDSGVSPSSVPPLGALAKGGGAQKSRSETADDILGFSAPTQGGIFGLAPSIDLSDLTAPAADTPLGPPTLDIDPTTDAAIPVAKAKSGAKSKPEPPTTPKPKPTVATEEQDIPVDLADDARESGEPEPSVDTPASAPAKSNRGLLFVIGALGVASLGYWAIFIRPKPDPGAAAPTSSAPLAAVEPAVTAKPDTTETNDDPEPVASAAPVASEPTKVAAREPDERSPSPTKPLDKAASEAQPKVDKPEPKADKPEPKADKPEPKAAATEAGGEFNKGAASAALGAAAGRAGSCRRDGDPSGTATVVVTYAPSGRITSANVSGPPFAGTPTGGCIAATMRGATIPAFSGSHVTVSKTVVIR